LAQDDVGFLLAQESACDWNNNGIVYLLYKQEISNSLVAGLCHNQKIGIIAAQEIFVVRKEWLS
jgi:hypothetical protein